MGKAKSAPVFEISNLGRGSQEAMAGGRPRDLERTDDSARAEPSAPRRDRFLSFREGVSSLTLLFSRQQTGSYGRCERGTPEPREACVEPAKYRTQINRGSEPVTHSIGMRGSRQIRRKVMDAPGQDRPHAHNREEEHQRERKQYVAQRNHVRRTGRPGSGFHAPHCNQAVT